MMFIRSIRYACVGVCTVLGSLALAWASPPTPVPQFQAFLDKAARGEPVVIAYLGGSITRGASTWPAKGTRQDGQTFDYSAYQPDEDSWRVLTYEWLRERYEVKPGQFRQVNAGIGGTPSLLGAYRLEENILREEPDLVFVEFAVNDNGKSKLTMDHPTAASSILRTNASIIDRLREQNPQVAIFMPLSTHRMLEGSKYAGWAEILDRGLAQTRQAAEALRVPYLNLKETFYADGVSAEEALYYDGEDNAGNYVHPAPAGYQAYAKAVEAALAELFESGKFSFSSAEPVTAIEPYPVSPRLVLPDELLAGAPGWSVEVPQKAEVPIMQGKPCLVTGEPGKALEFHFTGTAIGLWCDGYSEGAMEVELDGEPLGLYANKVKASGKFRGRYSEISNWLDGSVPHTLRLTPVAEPDAPQPRILIYALTLDEG